MAHKLVRQALYIPVHTFTYTHTETHTQTHMHAYILSVSKSAVCSIFRLQKQKLTNTTALKWANVECKAPKKQRVALGHCRS